MRVVVRRVLIVVCSLMLLQIASDVWPQNVVKMSGLAYLDYRSHPRFKVGDWVKYHFSSKSDGGQTEDYDMTMLISGEETFWGDDCFWIETWSGGRTLPPQANAMLISYSIFGDSAWLQHLQVYQRKSASINESGELFQELTRRVLGGKATGEDRPSLTVLTDTLGTDTVRVASGLYRCVKVQRKAGIGSVNEKGDSTLRIENWDQRELYLSPKIPMTSLVREVDERWITHKTWKVGKSDQAVKFYALRGTGTYDIVAWGSGGLKPRMTPLYAQRPLAARPVVHGSRAAPRKRS